jgi:hypothetical protein
VTGEQVENLGIARNVALSAWVDRTIGFTTDGRDASAMADIAKSAGHIHCLPVQNMDSLSGRPIGQ